MDTVHTLLFFLREDSEKEDLVRAENCLKSLEKSRYTTVVVCNQGFWDNDRLAEYLKSFKLDIAIIGTGNNVGIPKGRSSCFEYVYEHFSNASYVSELHLDMIFTQFWEAPLVDFMNTYPEPVISCGIINKFGQMTCLDPTPKTLPLHSPDAMHDFLMGLRTDSIIYGYTHPCIHRLSVLKEIGDYDTVLFKGKQAFEDDSLLLGYYYYYGTKANWRPKINYQSVVYHEYDGQRSALDDSATDYALNFQGLLTQYGLMGIKHCASLHAAQESKELFANIYRDRYK